MHLYLQLTHSLAVTLIWLYCNKLVLRYVCLRVSDLGQVLISQPGIVLNYYIIINIINYKYLIIFIYIHIFPFYLILFSAPCVIKWNFALLQLRFNIQILSWWSYDSGRPIPVFVRSPWHKVDLCWFH